RGVGAPDQFRAQSERDDGLGEGAAPAPAQPAAKSNAQKPNRAKRGGKAPMPSWEDVLLGVRSSGH
ncbi:septation protein SepH, partial [Nocardia sp. NPDC004582]